MTHGFVKRGSPILYRYLALLLWFAAVQTAAADGIVYQITPDGGPVSYLVGTMHSEDPRVIGLLDELRPLIGQVDVVAVEMLPDAITMVAVGAASLLPPGQSLHGLIGAERFEALADAARYVEISPDVLDRLRPWAAAVALGMPAAESGRFLDMEIYLHARELGRRTIGLETAMEQLSVFQDMPMPLQIALLEEMVKNAVTMPKQLEALTAAFLSGDLDVLEREARAQYAGLPPDMLDWFNKALLDDRNARMLTRMQPLIEQGGALVAVGALHLPGETGLVAGLRGLGYDVRRWSR